MSFFFAGFNLINTGAVNCPGSASVLTSLRARTLIRRQFKPHSDRSRRRDMYELEVLKHGIGNHRCKNVQIKIKKR